MSCHFVSSLPCVFLYVLSCRCLRSCPFFLSSCLVFSSFCLYPFHTLLSPFIWTFLWMFWLILSGPGLIYLVSSFLFFSLSCLVLSRLWFEQSKTTNPSSHVSSICRFWLVLSCRCLRSCPLLHPARPHPKESGPSRGGKRAWAYQAVKNSSHPLRRLLSPRVICRHAERNCVNPI